MLGYLSICRLASMWFGDYTLLFFSKFFEKEVRDLGIHAWLELVHLFQEPPGMKDNDDDIEGYVSVYVFVCVCGMCLIMCLFVVCVWLCVLYVMCFNDYIYTFFSMCSHLKSMPPLHLHYDVATCYACRSFHFRLHKRKVKWTLRYFTNCPLEISCFRKEFQLKDPKQRSLWRFTELRDYQRVRTLSFLCMFWGAFLLTNLNLDSSIANWIRLLTRWNIKSKSGSVSHGCPWVEFTLGLLISGSCNNQECDR